MLFDSWKAVFAEKFLETLRKIVDLRDIDYIVVHHMEPDHSGSIPKVLKENGNKAEVLGHPLAKGMLESFYGIKPKFKAVKDGEVLEAGRKLRFIYAPWLHWPETIMTFIEDLGVLLTCDAFGGFSIPSSIFDEENVLDKYLPYVRKYIIDIVGHYSSYILKAVDKLKSLNISPKVIAPAHGLAFKNNPSAIIDYYVKVAKGEPTEGKVTVVYGSMYGFVRKAISVILDELEKRGFKSVVHAFTDKVQANMGDILADVIDSEAVVLGAATYEAEVFPLMMYFAELLSRKIKVSKPVLVVSSYGWRGVADKRLSAKLSEAGFNVVDVVEFRGAVRDSDVAKLRESVSKLIDAIKG